VGSSANEQTPKFLRVALVAGEESGDILASGLMSELQLRHPSIQFEGVGGSRMQSLGLESIFPMERLSVMGLVEVLKRLPELLKRRKMLIREWLKNPPDLFIGIDAPDFNLGLERALKSAGVPTVHYVSPSVWAWREKRLRKIVEAVDTMLCFLPFEAQYYQSTPVRAEFIGHPLASRLPPDLTQFEARERLGLDPDRPVVCLMPGSRASEIEKLITDFLETAIWLKQRRADLQFVMPAANAKGYQRLCEALAQRSGELKVMLVQGESQTALVASDAVLIASGTATLEAMLCRCPMVVAYRMSGLTYRLISRMLRTNYVSLPNLLANELLVPEILQDRVTAGELGPLLLRALDDRAYREYLLNSFDTQAERLRLNADQRAADAVDALLQERARV